MDIIAHLAEGFVHCLTPLNLSMLVIGIVVGLRQWTKPSARWAMMSMRQRPGIRKKTSVMRSNGAMPRGSET